MKPCAYLINMPGVHSYKYELGMIIQDSGDCTNDCNNWDNSNTTNIIFIGIAIKDGGAVPCDTSALLVRGRHPGLLTAVE